MKRVLWLLMLLLGISGCTKSQNTIHKAIYSDYGELTLQSLLEEKALNSLDGYYSLQLPYEDKLAYLVIIEKTYFIDFDLSKTYIYQSGTQGAISYTNEMEEFIADNISSLTDFIQLVELEENIVFRKFDYLIYDSIRSILSKENRDYVSFKSGGNRGAFHPNVVIKYENIQKITHLKDIASQLDLTGDMILSLTKRRTAQSSVELSNSDIRTIYNEAPSEVITRVKDIYTTLTQ